MDTNKRNLKPAPEPMVKLQRVSTEPMKTNIKTPTNTGKNPLIDESCISFLNYRIQQEEYSSRTYLAMSMWLQNSGYLNAAKLWKKYSDEEINHANMARDYLLNMGVQPATPALEQPTENFQDFLISFVRVISMR